MRICQAPRCNNDISHMRADARYCSTLCRVNANNAAKQAANPRAVTTYAPPQALPSGDIGAAILSEIQITNDLLRQMLARGMGASVEVTETITKKVVLAQGGQPAQPQLAAPPAPLEGDNDLIEIVAPTKNLKSNSARILILQVWLATDVAYISKFSLDDLAMVTGHPAFNQALVQAELARRQGGEVVITPSAKAPKQKGGAIKGSEVTFAAPDYDNLDLDLF